MQKKIEKLMRDNLYFEIEGEDEGTVAYLKCDKAAAEIAKLIEGKVIFDMPGKLVNMRDRNGAYRAFFPDDPARAVDFVITRAAYKASGGLRVRVKVEEIDESRT